MCFYFQCDSTPPPLQVLKGESACPHWNSEEIKSQTLGVCRHTHIHAQAIFNPAFNTSYRKHQESSLLKKHGGET